MSNIIIKNNTRKGDEYEDTECGICCMTFNNSSRAKIKCNKCEITCKTYAVLIYLILKMLIVCLAKINGM